MERTILPVFALIFVAGCGTSTGTYTPTPRPQQVPDIDERLLVNDDLRAVCNVQGQQLPDYYIEDGLRAADDYLQSDWSETEATTAIQSSCADDCFYNTCYSGSGPGSCGVGIEQTCTAYCGRCAAAIVDQVYH